MSMVEQISVLGYRGFAVKQTLRLATRKNAARAMTILVGPNGGGKSTLLESLELICRATTEEIPENQRNRQTLYRVELSGRWTDGRVATLQSSLNNPSQLTVEPSGFARSPVRTISLQRAIPSQIDLKSKSWIEHSEKQRHMRLRRPAEDHLGSRIVAWNDPDHAIKKILREAFGINFEPINDGKALNISIDGVEHPPPGLGEGIGYLLHVLDAIHDAPQDALIMIDEPEAALHPRFAKALLHELYNASQEIQIVYSTHSPYMVDFGSLLEGAELARVFRTQGGCQIRQLGRESLSKMQGFLSNICNPHILGTDARGTFFLHDKIILLEGQEDVCCFREMAKQVGVQPRGEFFGWGVGGAGNMRHIAQLLKDLGYQHVVGILDNDKQSELQNLRELFPDYAFLAICTDDVRDKRKDGTDIPGLCDRSGRIHPQHFEYVGKFLTDVNKQFEKQQPFAQ